MTAGRTILAAGAIWLVGATNPPPELDATLDRVAAATGPDTSHRGMHSDFFTDPVGRFMDLLAAGAVEEARGMGPAMCAAWEHQRERSAFSGRFAVQGVLLNLDLLCTIEGARRP